MYKFVLITLFTLIVTVSIGIAVLYYQNTNEGTGAYSEITSGMEFLNHIDELLTQQRYGEAQEAARTFLNSDGVSEEETLRALNQLSISVVNMYFGSLGEDAAEEVSYFYVALLEYAHDEGYSDEFRASIMPILDKTFVETSFDVELLTRALEQYDEGRYYNQYLEDSSSEANPYQIAYSALYDLNAYAHDLHPDKFFIGFQAWAVAISFLESEPPDQLFEPFRNYLVDQFRTFDEAEIYSVNRPEHLDKWLEENVSNLQERLIEKYPQEFSGLSTSTTDQS